MWKLLWEKNKLKHSLDFFLHGQMRLNQTLQLALSWIGWMILFFAEKLTVNYVFIFNFIVLECTNQPCAGIPRRPNARYCTTHTINVPQRLTSTTGGRLLQQSQALQWSWQMEVYFKYEHITYCNKEKRVLSHILFSTALSEEEVPAQRWFKEQRSLQPCSMSGNTHKKRGGNLNFLQSPCANDT